MTTQTLMAAEVVQGTVTTRSLAVPAGTGSVSASVSVRAADLPGLEVRAELEGLFFGVWVRMAAGDLAGGPLSATGPPAARVRVVLEPSRPVRIGVDITFGS